MCAAGIIGEIDFIRDTYNDDPNAVIFIDYLINYKCINSRFAWLSDVPRRVIESSSHRQHRSHQIINNICIILCIKCVCLKDGEEIVSVDGRIRLRDVTWRYNYAILIRIRALFILHYLSTTDRREIRRNREIPDRDNSDKLQTMGWVSSSLCEESKETKACNRRRISIIMVTIDYSLKSVSWKMDFCRRFFPSNWVFIDYFAYWWCK